MPDYTETVWIELSGEEGFNFEDLRVSEIKGVTSWGEKFHYIYPENKRQTRIVFKAMGLRDDKGSIRDWGVSMLDVEEGMLVSEGLEPAGTPSSCPVCQGATQWQHNNDGWWAHCDKCKVDFR